MFHSVRPVGLNIFANKSLNTSGVRSDLLTKASFQTMGKELINLFYNLKGKFWAIELPFSYRKYVV